MFSISQLKHHMNIRLEELENASDDRALEIMSELQLIDLQVEPQMKQEQMKIEQMKQELEEKQQLNQQVKELNKQLKQLNNLSDDRKLEITDELELIKLQFINDIENNRTNETGKKTIIIKKLNQQLNNLSDDRK